MRLNTREKAWLMEALTATIHSMEKDKRHDAARGLMLIRQALDQGQALEVRTPDPAPQEAIP